jgi:hypothetical protein
MVSVISNPSYQVLFATATTARVDDLVDHIFLRPIFCDHCAGSGELSVREKVGVVGDEWFQ